MIENRTVIYIAGYGRSGSTLLDSILGSSDQAISTGELNTIFDEALEGNNCSCGQSYASCKQWSSLFKTLDQKELESFRDVYRQVDSRQSILRPHSKDLSSQQKKVYIAATLRLFNLLNSDIVIDSSKTAQNGTYRPIALKRIFGCDVKIIHLKRKFRSVLKSIRKGSNRKLLGKKDIRVKMLAQFGLNYKQPYFENDAPLFVNLLRASVGYCLANREAANLRKELGEENFLQIDFEHLIREPVEVLSQLEQKFSIDLSKSRTIIKEGKAFTNGHIVGGNRMAQSQVVLDPSR